MSDLKKGYQNRVAFERSPNRSILYGKIANLWTEPKGKRIKKQIYSSLKKEDTKWIFDMGQSGQVYLGIVSQY